jgi:hypothetical protein
VNFIKEKSTPIVYKKNFGVFLSRSITRDRKKIRMIRTPEQKVLQKFELFLDKEFPGWYDESKNALNIHESTQGCFVHGTSCHKFTTPKWLYCAKGLALQDKFQALKNILPRPSTKKACETCGKVMKSNEFSVELHLPDHSYTNPHCLSCDFTVG